MSYSVRHVALKKNLNRRGVLFFATAMITGIVWIAITQWFVYNDFSSMRGSYDLFTIPSKQVHSVTYSNAAGQLDELGEVFSLGVSGTMNIRNPKGWARVVLIDQQGVMHLIASASYPDQVVDMKRFCHETCLMKGIVPSRIEISTFEADVRISTIDVVVDQKKLKYTNVGKSLADAQRAYTESQARVLANKLDAALVQTHAPWKAAVTDVSLMTFDERSKMFDSWFLDSPGLQFYQSGTFPINIAPRLDTQSELTLVGTGVLSSDTFWYNRTVQNSSELAGHTTWLLRAKTIHRWGMNGYVNIVFDTMLAPAIPSSCTPLEKSSQAAVAAEDFGGWELMTDQKIISTGDTGRWDDQLVFRPYVVKGKNGDTYLDRQRFMYVYYNGSGSVSGVDNDQIGLAIGPPGGPLHKNDGPVLAFGPKGRFDDADVQVGSVIFADNRFHMWYTANSDSNPSDFDTIGYASSADGITWNRSSFPILSQGTGDDALDLYQPIVFYYAGQWQMLYAGHNKNNQFGIMQAFADHPEGPWTKRSDHYAFFPGYDIFPSEVIKSGAQLSLYYYHIYSDDLPRTEFRAVSKDGQNWNEENALYTYDRLAIPIAQDFSLFTNQKKQGALTTIYADGSWSIVSARPQQDQSAVWRLNPLRYLRWQCGA